MSAAPDPRSRSFGAVAAAYAAHRPGYPAAAAAWALAPLGGIAAPRVLDLGAGTGKLTEALPDHAEVTAVDPDPAMLDELRARFPHVRAAVGTAEEIPLPDASVDAVLSGQAWHWFDPDRALPEIARVLRPGGVLAAVWNDDGADVEWMRGIGEAAAAGRPVRPNTAGSGASAFPPHPAFAPPERAAFPNPVPTTTEGLVAMLATHSWALVSEPADREAAFARLRDYLTTRPETASGEFVLPLAATVLRALRR